MLRNFAVRLLTIAICLSVLASAGAAPALAAPAAGLTPPFGLLWDLQRPEEHAYADHMGPRSIFAGLYGTFYAAYGGSHLYLYQEDQVNSWTETVDPAWGVGLYASLAVDTSASYAPRISYIDQLNSRLKYASNYNGNWTIETLEGLNGAKGHTSLALLPGIIKSPGISYYAWDNQNHRGILKYAYNTCVPLPCHWVYQTPDWSSNVYNGENSSLGYNSANRPVIAYSVTDHQTVSYLNAITWTGSTWAAATLDDGVAVDSIAMANSGDTFFISYAKNNSGTGKSDLKVAWNTAGGDPYSWHTETVDNTAVDKAWITSVTLTSGGVPYIAYGYDLNSTSERLKAAHWVGSVGTGCGNAAWTCEVAQWSPPERVMPDHISVAMGEDGITPLIAYTNSLDDDSEYLLNVRALGNPWSSRSLANLDELGYVTSLALDASGWAHISHDGDSGGLFFTEQTGASAWSTIQVTSGLQTVNLTSLALDPPSNTPYIAYIRYGALMEAHPVASSGNCGPSNTWLCETITTAAISSYGYVSLAIYNHTPYIAYHDYNNKRLALASYVGSGGSGCLGGTAAWNCVGLDSTVAGESDIGFFPSLAISSTGQATIVYGTKTTAPSYKLEAIRGSIASLAQGTGITQVTILSDIGNNSYGGYLSIANGDHPHASYYQSLPGSIGVGHAEYVGSGGSGCAPSATPAWKCELLVTTGEAGRAPMPRQTSIDADAAGNVAISYAGIDPNFYTTLDVLRYVGAGGNAGAGRWYWQNLAGSGETGTDSSIKLDSRGLPRVSVYNATTGHLRYAVSEYGVFVAVVRK